MVSQGLYFVMEGFYGPKVVNLRDFTVSLLSKIPSLVLLINGYLISIINSVYGVPDHCFV
jgi:hypothetical protein